MSNIISDSNFDGFSKTSTCEIVNTLMVTNALFDDYDYYLNRKFVLLKIPAKKYIGV